MRCLLLVLVLSAGCAAALGPTQREKDDASRLIACPQRGGSTWIELTSPNFRLRTTEPEWRARIHLQHYEDTLTALRSIVELVLPVAPNPSRTSITLFDLQSQFQLVVGWTIDGITLTDERGDTGLVLEADYPSTIFRHELIHRLIRQRLPNAPPWLNEGMAEYFPQSQIQGGVAHVGLLSPRLVRVAQSLGDSLKRRSSLLPSDLPRLNELMAATEAKLASGDKYYIAAWAAVHYLLNGPPDGNLRFRAFIADLGAGVDQKTALERHYGPLPELATGYARYLEQLARGEPTREWKFPVDVARFTVQPQVRPLDDAEVHWLWSWLWPARTGEQLTLAQEHLPSSPKTLLFAARVAFAHDDQARVDQLLKAALAQAPNDRLALTWSVSRRVAQQAELPTERRNLLPLDTDVRRLAKVADETPELAAIALYGAIGGDIKITLPAAQRAVALDPLCFNCQQSLARIYYNRRDFEAAVTTLADALAHPRPANDRTAVAATQLACYRKSSTSDSGSCPF